MSDNLSNSFLDKIGYFGDADGEPKIEPIENQQEEEQQHEQSEDSKNQQEANAETPIENGEEENSFTYSFEEQEEEPDTKQELLETKVKDKVKYDLKGYVDNHYDTISNYIKYRDLDVDSMSSEDLIRNKLKLENPSWNATHIEQELQDTYGIGLKKVELPEDEFSDEYRKAQAHNERVEEITRRGERLLISDVSKAKQTLKDERERVLSLPEVELDVELTANPEQILEQYQAKFIEEQNKFKEEVWKPNIETAVNKIGIFKQDIDLGSENGEKVLSELRYKFTDTQKQNLKEYLESYVAQPSDAKYIVNEETGEVDYQRFANDKALQLFAPEIIKSSVKELTAQFKQKFIKEDMVNYSDEPKRKSPTQQQNHKDFAREWFQISSQSVKR